MSQQDRFRFTPPPPPLRVSSCESSETRRVPSFSDLETTSITALPRVTDKSFMTGEMSGSSVASCNNKKKQESEDDNEIVFVGRYEYPTKQDSLRQTGVKR